MRTSTVRRREPARRLAAALARDHRPGGGIPPVVAAHHRAAWGEAALTPASRALAPAASCVLAAHQERPPILPLSALCLRVYSVLSGVKRYLVLAAVMD